MLRRWRALGIQFQLFRHRVTQAVSSFRNRRAQVSLEYQARTLQQATYNRDCSRVSSFSINLESDASSTTSFPPPAYTNMPSRKQIRFPQRSSQVPEYDGCDQVTSSKGQIQKSWLKKPTRKRSSRTVTTVMFHEPPDSPHDETGRIPWSISSTQGTGDIKESFSGDKTTDEFDKDKNTFCEHDYQYLSHQEENSDSRTSLGTSGSFSEVFSEGEIRSSKIRRTNSQQEITIIDDSTGLEKSRQLYHHHRRRRRHRRQRTFKETKLQDEDEKTKPYPTILRLEQKASKIKENESEESRVKQQFNLKEVVTSYGTSVIQGIRTGLKNQRKKRIINISRYQLVPEKPNFIFSFLNPKKQREANGGRIPDYKVGFASGFVVRLEKMKRTTPRMRERAEREVAAAFRRANSTRRQ